MIMNVEDYIIKVQKEISDLEKDRLYITTNTSSHTLSSAIDSRREAIEIAKERYLKKNKQRGRHKWVLLQQLAMEKIILTQCKL